MPTIDKAKARADIARVQDVLCSDSFNYEGLQIDTAAMRACIERWSPPGSAYRRPFAQATTRRVDLGEWEYTRGQLEALRRDIEDDMLGNFAEMVHAALFSDLLGQAQHLLAESYTLAAAVIAGATLEEHVRKLADKHGVDTVKPNGDAVKAGNLNDQIGKAAGYSQADHDLIAGWLKLRNEAAHNEPAFQARTSAEISLMIEGVRGLLARHPA